MPSPLNKADNPRLCSGKSKEEVMANFAVYWGKSQRNEITPETREQRMIRQADALAESILWHNNTRAASFPLYEITGPALRKEYTDQRLIKRRGRYGAFISD